MSLCDQPIPLNATPKDSFQGQPYFPPSPRSYGFGLQFENERKNIIKLMFMI